MKQETSSKTPWVGQSVPRIDGAAKVRGVAKYVDDVVPENLLHGKTVRSTVAHGVLRAIVPDPEFDWSDVTVVTAADIPGTNTILLLEEDQPALVPVGGIIRHVDEAVALVAAPTREKAIAAAQAFVLNVDPLPTILSAHEALVSAVKLHGQDNVFKTINLQKGDIKLGFAAADLVVEGEYQTSAQEQMYIEPQGMIAHYATGGNEDELAVLGSLQCPYYVHKALKRLFALPGEKVVVEQAVTGGGFGGKEEYPSMIAAHAGLLAKKAKRPVKIVYDREEDIAATTKRHPSFVRHRMGLKKDGSICAIEVDVLLDGGAYMTLSPVVLSRAVLHAAGPYQCEHVSIRGRVVATNTPPHGAFRGFGAPQTTFAYERQIEKAASLLNIDPFEFRHKNALRSGHTTATGQLLTYSVGSDAVLSAVQKQLQTVPGKKTATGSRLARGHGYAFYFHGAGFTGSGEQRLAGQATVAARADGLFEVRSSSTDIGQGALTMFAQIAADKLRVPISSVVVTEPSTARVPDSGPTVASRTCMVVGGVVDRAAGTLRAQISELAATAGANIDTTENLHRFIKEHVAKHGEVVQTETYSPPPGIVWSDDTYQGSAYPVYGWACCYAEVAVNLDTFEVLVERFIHAIDVGKAIHPRIVQGQIEGGTLQALGWALSENVLYKDGRVANRKMSNCIVPTFLDAPDMETLIVEEPYPFGPSGAKGVGEIPMDGPAAAIANALQHALGENFDALPFLPETICAALSARKSV